MNWRNSYEIVNVSPNYTYAIVKETRRVVADIAVSVLDAGEGNTIRLFNLRDHDKKTVQMYDTPDAAADALEDVLDSRCNG